MVIPGRLLMVKCFVFLCFCALSPIVSAGVVESSKTGFLIRIQAEVDVAPPQVWDQFLAVGEWWSGDHSWFGKASGFSIEPRAGGCFCETDGDRSALHMLVSYVDPGKEMRMIGGLGPLQGLVLQGAMTFRFEPLESGGTRIVHIYRVMGHTENGLDELAPIVDSVQQLQINGLVAALSS